MDNAVVLIDRPESGVLRLRINRPHKRNAVDKTVREALHAALASAATDPTCRAVVLGGVDGIFSAGGDLPSMVGMSEPEARARMRDGHRLCRLVAGLRVPVVSAAEGPCAGAMVGLALLGDHVVVGASTRILLPFLKLGLVPDWGLLYSLPARLGRAGAQRVLCEAAPLSGEDALRIGLADSFADGDVMAAAVARAQALAALSPQAFARMKARWADPSPSLEHDLQREEDDQTAMFIGPDFKAGFAAYVDKREPRFASTADPQQEPT